MTRTHPFNLTVLGFVQQAAFGEGEKKQQINRIHHQLRFRGAKGIAQGQQRALKKWGQLVPFTTHGQGTCKQAPPSCPRGDCHPAEGWSHEKAPRQLQPREQLGTEGAR